MKAIITLILLVVCIGTVKAQMESIKHDGKIILEGAGLAKLSENGNVEIVSGPHPSIKIGYQEEETKKFYQSDTNNIPKWKWHTSIPIYVRGNFLGYRSVFSLVLEPGDSVRIEYEGNNMTFTGRGADKCQLIYLLQRIKDSLAGLPEYHRQLTLWPRFKSVKNFMIWDSYLNTMLRCCTPLVESYKSFLSPFAFNAIKVNLFTWIEDARIQAFLTLRGQAPQQSRKGNDPIVNQAGLSNSDLIVMYDSMFNSPAAHWLQYEAPLVTDPAYLYHKIILDVYREKKMFFKESDTSILDREKYEMFYNAAKKKYKGIIREAVLSYIFWYTRGAFYKVGFTPEIEKILADYYSQSKYPEYKEYTRKSELEQRTRHNKRVAPDFSLKDAYGQVFTQEKLKGKVAIIDFWYTGCVGCVEMKSALNEVKLHFKGDSNVVFVSISIDENKDIWLKNIIQKKNGDSHNIDIYTGGKGSSHEVIKRYGVAGYPSLHIINPFNKVLYAKQAPDLNDEERGRLLELIQNQAVLTMDGPYVFHNGDSSVIYSIAGTSVTTSQHLKDQATVLQVQSDIYNQTFPVSLKNGHKAEKSVYAKPEKLLALSDIEGNFDMFRKLLQANGVIDEKFNWIFSNGHLILIGDMFDRGNQVTECLWLIYSLEEKAKISGGYVHYILGNHEIMNLRGNHRYVQQKYSRNADLLKIKLPRLYGENSELGRWLRTKNVMEKVGDILFVHGGISDDVSQTNLSVDEINELLRPYYASVNIDSSNSALMKINSTSTSPFWYRGYYAEVNLRPSMQQIDDVLQRFGVNQIITGHTIVEGSISAHYNGKVINTDTEHARGKSEALLVEGSTYYRVNTNGNKTLLFPSETLLKYSPDKATSVN